MFSTNVVILLLLANNCLLSVNSSKILLWGALHMSFLNLYLLTFYSVTIGDGFIRNFVKLKSRWWLLNKFLSVFLEVSPHSGKVSWMIVWAVTNEEKCINWKWFDFLWSVPCVNMGPWQWHETNFSPLRNLSGISTVLLLGFKFYSYFLKYELVSDLRDVSFLHF